MDSIEEIKRLKSLLDEGAITENEFNELKRKVINKQIQIPLTELKSSNNSQSTSKRRPSLVKRIILISVFALITAMIVFGIKYYEPIKEKIASVLQKPNSEKTLTNPKRNDIVYENGKEIGRIVKIEIISALPHTGAGVNPINVPTGKMWTPLYYELTNGSPSHHILYIYPVSTIYGYLNSEAYEFDETKNTFVSYKLSKQNHKAFSGQGNAGVIVNAWSPSTYTLYFLEESLY